MPTAISTPDLLDDLLVPEFDSLTSVGSASGARVLSLPRVPVALQLSLFLLLGDPPETLELLRCHRCFLAATVGRARFHNGPSNEPNTFRSSSAAVGMSLVIDQHT